MASELGRRHPLSDLYLLFLASRWRNVILALLGAYLVVNSLFALLYLLGGNTIENATPGSFRDAFFFSSQTLTTVGYGKLHPRGLYADVLACAESLIGLLGFAVAAGLMFAKFSRPTAKVIFSRVAVISPRYGRPHLMFRMANGRASHILEARLTVVMVKSETTPEGEIFRKLVDIPLVRRESPAFAQTWTALHLIDENSPFWGETRESLQSKQAEIYLTFLGVEATFSQTVHTRYTYRLSEILWDHKLVDVISLSPEGRTLIDYTRFHDAVPV